MYSFHGIFTYIEIGFVSCCPLKAYIYEERVYLSRPMKFWQGFVLIDLEHAMQSTVHLFLDTQTKSPTARCKWRRSCTTTQVLFPPSHNSLYFICIALLALRIKATLPKHFKWNHRSRIVAGKKHLCEAAEMVGSGGAGHNKDDYN